MLIGPAAGEHRFLLVLDGVERIADPPKHKVSLGIEADQRVAVEEEFLAELLEYLEKLFS